MGFSFGEIPSHMVAKQKEVCHFRLRARHGGWGARGSGGEGVLPRITERGSDSCATKPGVIPGPLLVSHQFTATVLLSIHKPQSACSQSAVGRRSPPGSRGRILRPGDTDVFLFGDSQCIFCLFRRNTAPPLFNRFLPRLGRIFMLRQGS